MTYGLTIDGFLRKPLAAIKADLEAKYRAAFGTSINLRAQSVFGQIIGITSGGFDELWQLLESVNSARDPDNATGVQLVKVAGLTGTLPTVPTPSKVTATLVGTAGTPVVAGKVGSVETTGARFDTLADATITALAAWAGGAFEVGARVTKGGYSYQCIANTGDKISTVGPSITGEGTEVDHHVTWQFLGAGDGAIDVECASEETGPVIALAGTLNVIETPVSGWNAITNILDATEGEGEESDASLRVRREDELHQNANAATEAVRIAVKNSDPDITTCRVFENYTDADDADGVPPHSIEVLVRGGDDETIRRAIFASKASGIRAFGSNSGTVTDSQGNDHTIAFSRPTEKLAYVDLAISKDPAFYPTDGDAQVKAAVAAVGDAFEVAQNIVAARLGAAGFRVLGVLDVVPTLISVAPTNPPVAATTIAIGPRELAVFDTSRVTVTSSDGAP